MGQTVAANGPAVADDKRAVLRRRQNTVSLAAVGFALLQIPLTLIAIAFEWRNALQGSDKEGSLLADFAANGSAISGPLLPQVIFLALALLARRQDRWGIAATAGVGVMGILVTVNGAAVAFSEPIYAPREALVAAAVLFTGLGLALIALSARAVAPRLRGARR